MVTSLCTAACSQADTRASADAGDHAPDGAAQACGPLAMGKKREVCCSRVSCVIEGGFPPSLGPFEQPQRAAIATKRWRARSMSTEASQP